MIDYTELKRLAEAATAGPWIAEEWAHKDSDGAIEHCGLQVISTSKLCGVYSNAPEGDEEMEKDVRYIAAASPDVVLRLIAVIDKLRTQNQALREALKDLKRQYSEHPDAFWDWSEARAALALAEGVV